MTESRDDDSLSWGGDVDDPSYLDGSTTASADAADADDADADAAEVETEAPATSAVGSAMLVTYGILGGVYLLYSIGWIVSVQRDTFTASNVFFEIMHQLGEFLAIAAPPVWFGLTFLLTPGRRPLVRLGWLVAGVLLLAPLPFILSGSAA